MRELGILFKADMIRAIQEGRKTQMRRIILPQPSLGFEVPRIIDNAYWELGHWDYCSAETRNIWQPTGRFKVRYPVGDILYVKKADATLWLRVIEVKEPHRIQNITADDIEAEGIDISIDGRRTANHFRADCWRIWATLWDSINAKPKSVYEPIGFDGKEIITHYVSYPWQDIQETREHRGKPWIVCGNPFVFLYVFERIEK
uniref:ASCH domain-containing protein n=1 Tax=viral metagenome TaxID=1070528 RepID=A0A6H1ZNL8_9ZZZZ